MTDTLAVVGMDCRFPGAPDRDAFWRLLMDGTVTDTEIPSQRWDVDAFYHPGGAAGTMNTRRAHFIDGADAFDNDFFGIAPVEAAALDPQQRMLLQSCWHALEDAGTDPRSLAGTATGVYVGIMSSEWGSLQMADFGGLTAARGMGSGYFMAANRISYHLNLTGPSVAVDSACSSSLVAIHQGCAALRSGEADTVIAAGVNLLLTPALSIFYTQAGLSAADGRCKPFGQGADGIGRGEGVAAVVLRRLADAVADRQPIYALVRSSVTNHDGRSNGITAPNRNSQAALMRRALELAAREPRQIEFVEAHGTGTVLGDMIEANALGDLHKIRRDRPCLLGSVKGNIGHTEGCAGIAAFIKSCLALSRRRLPPTVYGGAANPGLRLDTLGLKLADRPHDLPADALGAVSSFGLGGSNAHVILQAPPTAPPCEPGVLGVLTVSAPSERALRRNADAVAAQLDGLDPAQLTAFCRTSNVVKRGHRHRLGLHGDHRTLTAGLRRYAAGGSPEAAAAGALRRVAARIGLLCPGQGGQYPGMTAPLYALNPVYRENLQEVVAAFEPHLPPGLLTTILDSRAQLTDTARAQPALFAVSYALGKTVQQSGVRFSFGIGHSVGEIAVAALAGVLPLRDAARLVAVRARLMGALPAGGAMVAIDTGAEQAEAVAARHPGCTVAAVNGPRAVTLSGDAAAVDGAAAELRAEGAMVLRLDVSHAFHSPLMGPVAAEFGRELRGLRPRSADFALFSTVLGREVDGADLDADYWVRQICAPVLFHEAAQLAARTSGADYLAEAGPRPTLLKLVRRAGLLPQAGALPLCTGPGSAGTELLAAAAALLRDGFSPDLTPLYGRAEGPRQRMPLYRFDTANRYWLAGSAAPARRAAAVSPAHPAADTGTAGPTNQEGPEHAVLALVADVGGYTAAQLSRDRLLAEELGYDSLLQLRLVERLRTQYPVLAEVSVADVLPTVRTVGDVVDFVLGRLDESPVTVRANERRTR